ncbi:TnsA-like heteromeric transposase endonuclease subunit, partial [Micromonospora sp. KC721]|uniref:TnsA-like heteromeric transposase endonuclease subunit n=1 Tax=Micromonospora sp. KC721 TaxID=2530380 RepID=UPI00104BBDB0
HRPPRVAARNHRRHRQPRFRQVGRSDLVKHADSTHQLLRTRSLVVDCRPVERIKPRDAVAFAETRRACELVGWEYRLVGAPEPVVVRNVRWLAGYRHPRYRLPGQVMRLREVFAEPAPLMDGLAAAGNPIAVLPVLFHLLWCGELTCDLDVRLHEMTVVTAVGAC